MKGLMELLSKSDSAKPADNDSDTASEATEAPDSDDTGFNESAAQAMEALKSGDSTAFADALKACIEMGH